MFLINVGILNYFLNKWFLFLIYFVNFHSFFFVFSVFVDCFAKFKRFYTLNDLLFYITNLEVHLLVAFMLKFHEHFAHMFHCIDHFIAFFVSIWFEQFMWSFLWNRFFHDFIQSVSQWFHVNFNFFNVNKTRKYENFFTQFFQFHHINFFSRMCVFEFCLNAVQQNAHKN